MWDFRIISSAATSQSSSPGNNQSTLTRARWWSLRALYIISAGCGLKKVLLLCMWGEIKSKINFSPHTRLIPKEGPSSELLYVLVFSTQLRGKMTKTVGRKWFSPVYHQHSADFLHSLIKTTTHLFPAASLSDFTLRSHFVNKPWGWPLTLLDCRKISTTTARKLVSSCRKSSSGLVRPLAVSMLI